MGRKPKLFLARKRKRKNLVAMAKARAKRNAKRPEQQVPDFVAVDVINHDLKEEPEQDDNISIEVEPEFLEMPSCSTVSQDLQVQSIEVEKPKSLLSSQIGVQNSDDPVFICEEHCDPDQENSSNSETQTVENTVTKKQITTTTIKLNTDSVLESRGLDKLVENAIKATLNKAGISGSQSTQKFDKMNSKTNLLHKSTSNVVKKTPPSQKSTSLDLNKSTSNSGNLEEATTSETLTTSSPASHVLGGMIRGASVYTLQIHAIQTQMNQLNTTPKWKDQLSLKLYLRFPKAYKHLQKALGLPKESDLKNIFKNTDLTADMRSLFFSYLIHKTNNLTEKQKQCFICIAEIKIKPRFYYDIRKDRLLGIHDYDGVLKPEPATTAVVLILQGIYCDWKQPIAVAYLADDTMSIKQWVVNNICLLLNIGYNVQAIVCQKDSHYFTIRNKEFLKVNKKKIFCTYDIISLLKNLYYNFTQNDFYFDGVIVQCQNLIKFYESDSKKQLPLNPKLSDNHMYPENLQELKIQTVMEVCSMTTAAAMSTYIDFGILDETASKTVQFIVKMSEILDAFNTDKDKKRTKNDFAGVMSPIDNLIDVLELIESALMVEHLGNTSLVKLHDNLREKFKIHKNFLFFMSHYIEDLPFERFTAAAADIFSEQAQVHSKSITEPTARDVNTIFRQTAIINLLKNPFKDCEPIDMQKVFTEFQVLIKGFKPFSTQDDRETEDLDVIDYFITSSEYNELELKKKDGIIFIAGFLLKKCHGFHKCPDLNLCIYKTSNDEECLSMCESIMGDVRNGICNVPSTDIIEYVESMEIVFRTFMNKEILGRKNILAGIVSCLKSIDAPLPCKCFPVDYLQKLYTRFRIFHTLKFNNELIKSKDYKRIVVNRL